jgi:hypothetical protein
MRTRKKGIIWKNAERSNRVRRQRAMTDGKHVVKTKKKLVSGAAENRSGSEFTRSGVFRVSPNAGPDERSSSANLPNFEPDHRSGSASVRSEPKFGTEL